MWNLNDYNTFHYTIFAKNPLMLYLIIKAIHIIFMVSYFAGIFYLVRLFVYYKDTDEFDEVKQQILRKQYSFMAVRLWNIITVPAGIIMLSSGLTMIFLNSGLLKTPWFHLKLTFLVGLGIYHFWCWNRVKELKNLNGKILSIPNIKLRQFNEIATFILFAVVFTVILKYTVIEYWWQLLLGFFGIIVIITSIVKLVNKKKNSNRQP